MNLDEYTKKIGFGLPKLSKVYRKYSNVFIEYYELIANNLIFIEVEDNECQFFILKNEWEEHQQRKERNEYVKNNYETIASEEEISQVEKSYSNGFNQGFHEINFQPNLVRNIFDNIIFSHNDPVILRYGILRYKGKFIHNNKIRNKDILILHFYNLGLTRLH
ncbi:hypothetical protein ACFLSY_05890, partial [Bacteroidota bacterium]